MTIPGLLLGSLTMATGLACATASPQTMDGPGIFEGESVVGDTPTPMPVPPPDEEICTARTGMAIKRDAVKRVIETGLGFWLRGVRVRPRLESGQFQGWIVQSFYPDDVCYQDLDIKVGDVVTKINGKSVERDHQAHAVFVALQSASEIVVDYEREGKPLKLQLQIVE